MRRRKEEEGGNREPSPLFEQSVGRAFSFAAEETILLRGELITTDTLLLGLIRLNSLILPKEQLSAGSILHSVGIDINNARQSAQTIPRKHRSRDQEHLQLSTTIKTVIHDAVRLAKDEKAQAVSDIHLLRALINTPGNPAIKMLEDLGINIDSLKRALEAPPAAADVVGMNPTLELELRIRHLLDATDAFLKDPTK